jgi:glycosyltransferase involved in cell wall biosynthesis
MTDLAVAGGERPVLLFVVNVAWFFRSHRLQLALAARQAGFDVHVATAPDTPEDVRAIEAAGLRHHPLNLRRGRWGLVEEWRLVRELRALYRNLRPAIVHQVTIKPVMFGTLAARLARVPGIVNSISGLGFIFIAKGALARIRRVTVLGAYRLVFRRRDVRVIFQNDDDLQLFLQHRVVRPSQAVLIRGAGVELDRFQPRRREGPEILAVLPARMLWDKGVREFCDAAARLRAAGVAARFVLAGGLDPGNPAAIDAAWLESEVRAGNVEWWGHRDDIAEVFAQAAIVCLPSYREGLPRALLEAAASGCALVATDVPGCREVVSHEITGLLVPAREPAPLAHALRRLVEDAALRQRLSEAARRRVVEEFSAERVNADTLALYRQVLAASHGAND